MLSDKPAVFSFRFRLSREACWALKGKAGRFSNNPIKSNMHPLFIILFIIEKLNIWIDQHSAQGFFTTYLSYPHIPAVIIKILKKIYNDKQFGKNPSFRGEAKFLLWRDCS
jgi:hypothetical protein